MIRDEGHRNRMTVPELEQRMRGWIAGEYRAVVYEEGGEIVKITWGGQAGRNSAT